MHRVNRFSGESDVVEMQSWLKRKALKLEFDGHFDESISYWKKILKQSSKQSPKELGQIHFRIGLLHRRQQHRIQSIYHFKQAIFHNPDEARYFEAFGKSFASAGHWRVAKHQFEKALRLQPGNDSLWRQFAGILFHLKMNLHALHAAKRAAQIAPDNSKNKALLLQMLAENSHWGEVKDVLEKWRKEAPSSEDFRVCQKFIQKKFNLSLQGAVLKYLKKRMMLENSFDLKKYVQAQELWLAHCSKGGPLMRERASMRLVKMWANALAQQVGLSINESGK